MRSVRCSTSARAAPCGGRVRVTGKRFLPCAPPTMGRRSLDRWKAWASVSSRHVVALRDVVRSEDGRWAIVQDFVPGRPLDVEIGSADLRPKATRRQIVEGIAAGMSALHGAGIVHGDLTPANIIVTPQGRAVIIDMIDEIGPGAGTPGWSLETSGMEGDRAVPAPHRIAPSDGRGPG